MRILRKNGEKKNLRVGYSTRQTLGLTACLGARRTRLPAVLHMQQGRPMLGKWKLFGKEQDARYRNKFFKALVGENQEHIRGASKSSVKTSLALLV